MGKTSYVLVCRGEGMGGAAMPISITCAYFTLKGVANVYIKTHTSSDMKSRKINLPQKTISTVN